MGNLFKFIGFLVGTIKNLFVYLLKKVKSFGSVTFSFAEQRPLTSLFVVLGILLSLIVAGSILRKSAVEEEIKELPPKIVETYKIGTAPTITIQAKIEKSGVVNIVAQTSGVVQKFHLREGQNVGRGTRLISLSTNYLAGNALSLQRELAESQHQNVENTFDLQKILIDKQKEAAEKTDTNADELRSITDKSLSETRSSIDLNNDILASINEKLTNLEATNVDGSNDELILQTKQLKSQFETANNQLTSALRTAEYQASDDKPAAELANLQREITQKQLELQEKALDLSLETSLIQLKLAQINESLMFPASPIAGKIERIHVRFGQQVSPGTPLVTLSGGEKSLEAIVEVPGRIARQVSKLEESTLVIGFETTSAAPLHISSEVTNGQLYSIVYAIPDNFTNRLDDSSFIRVVIPVGYADTGQSVPFVPLDAVVQTQDQDFVFVLENNKASSRKVSLGAVTGKFVEVRSGLEDENTVIVSRNVVSGDEVVAAQT